MYRYVFLQLVGLHSITLCTLNEDVILLVFFLVSKIQIKIFLLKGSDLWPDLVIFGFKSFEN